MRKAVSVAITLKAQLIAHKAAVFPTCKSRHE